MKLEIPPNPDKLPYFDADFAGGKLTLRWISEEEKDRLASEQRDAHFDMTEGTWSIRSEDGARRGSPRPFPFGPTSWEFVAEVLLAAAKSVYPTSEGCVYAIFYRIQKEFGKLPEKRQTRKGQRRSRQNKKERRTAKKSSFWFEVERNPVYRIRLNPARSFRIITNANLDGLGYAIDNQ
jgi:hypothetical protein